MIPDAREEVDRRTAVHSQTRSLLYLNQRLPGTPVLGLLHKAELHPGHGGGAAHGHLDQDSGIKWRQSSTGLRSHELGKLASLCQSQFVPTYISRVCQAICRLIIITSRSSLPIVTKSCQKWSLHFPQNWHLTVDTI